MKRPRFSLRMFAIVVTLICAYFSAWEATKRWGVENMSPGWTKYPDGSYHDLDFQQSAPAPFILRGAAPIDEENYDSGFKMVYYLGPPR